MTPLLDRLSEREEQVLVLIGEGLGLREIGELIGISWWTVKSYRDGARRKLGAANQAHAVAILMAARAKAEP